MAHATNEGSLVGPNGGARVDPNAMDMAPVANAVAVAYSIALVKTPVRFALNTVLAKLAGLLRYIADKSARGVYTALGSVVNNKLTRRISPSVSYLDSKIENACTVSGRWAGNVLVFPFTLAFYLLAAVYASAVSIVAAAALPAKFLLEAAWDLTVGSREEIYNDVFLYTKEKAEACKNTASKAAYMVFSLLWRFLFYIVLIPVIMTACNVIYQALVVQQAPFSAPVYMISSVFGLDNRFNIYNYKSGIGSVHGFIQDIIEKKHDSSYFFPNYARDRLIKEATKRDIDSTNTVAREEATTGDIDSRSTVDPQAPTKLDSLTVELLTQQPEKAASA